MKPRVQFSGKRLFGSVRVAAVCERRVERWVTSATERFIIRDSPDYRVACSARVDKVFFAMRRYPLFFTILGVLCSALAPQAAPVYVVADWTFEEGTVGAPVKQAVDQSGRGHDSTTIWGSPAYVAGSGSMGAVAIDCPPGGIFGSGFNVADAPDLVLTNEFTLEAAVVARYDNQGSRRVIVGRNGSYKNSYELGLYPDTDHCTMAV